MKLALYVHDLKLEIGHSNSLIELIRHFPEQYLDKIEEIEVVTYSTSPLEHLFPQFKGKIRWVPVPFPKLKPVLLKSLFYQLWTILYNRCFQKKGFLRIGIGISSLDVDAVSIQFIHHQWTERGLAQENSHRLRKIYKKILFAYFEWCENLLFRRDRLKVFSPAQFLTAFLAGKNEKLEASTIYSGVNLARFELGALTKEELLESLRPSYPVLTGIDVTKPIYLFVGAYERKGILEALELLAAVGGSPQFIVIGSPSTGRSVEWPESLKVFAIPFTREVPKFYSLADAFIFPTMYEPFGLVLFEAMAMGLTIVTRASEVGASELLQGLEDIHFCDQVEFKFPVVQVKDLAERRRLRESRLQALGDVSWTKAGKELAHFLSPEVPGRVLRASAPSGKMSSSGE